jgi:hydroxyacylglutathione hydrolase
VLLKRFYHDGLAQASYLIGCQRTGDAIVIDANREPEPYLVAARTNGLRIRLVTETHIHADYLSGSRELAHRTGAQLLLSAEGGPDWQYAFATIDGARLLHDGDVVQVGNVRLDVLHTPGHTPEHLVFAVTDLVATDQPVGVVTGDFLFVGDVGRPDLLERAAQIEGTMRTSASVLFDSLERFVERFADHVQVWPGHGAGSACGKSLGAVPSSTIGYEKLANWALRIRDREKFIEDVLAGQPDPPPYFAVMKRMNRDGPALLETRPPLQRLPVEHLDEVLSGGARVVDLRTAPAFAREYIPGTINIPLNRSFLSRAGWLLSHEREFYLIHDSDSDARARETLKELGMIGLDGCGGWFGSDAFARNRQRGALGSVSQVEPTELAQLIAADAVRVIDVRALDEWNAGHLEGAQHIPFGRIEEQLESVDPSRPVVLYCAGGGRSAVAASLLKAHGVTDVRNLRGGIDAWEDAGLPVAPEAEQATRA